MWHYLGVEDRSRDWCRNLSHPITCSFSDRRGRTCVVCHSGAGLLGTLKYNSFRWRSIRMFNRLPKVYSYAVFLFCCWIQVTA